MGKTILIVHGEDKQPEAKDLLEGCRKALGEILSEQEMGKIKIDLVYYSDLLYSDKTPFSYLSRVEISEKTTLTTKIKHSLLNALTAKHLRSALGDNESFDRFNEIYEEIFISMKNSKLTMISTLEDILLQKKEIVLEIFKRLESKIEEYPEDEILLLAHSGGSLFAFEGLSYFESQEKKLNLDDFFTLGSPLGITVIQDIMKQSFLNLTEKSLELVTPSSIQNRWYNFSDILDPISFTDPKLNSDFKANFSGVHPIDFMVDNDWEINTESETAYHSIYGYLRDSLLIARVRDFIS